MKPIKQLISALCVGALMLTMVGCTPSTAETLLADLEKSVDGRSLTAATVTMDLELSAEVGKLVEDITMHIHADTLLGDDERSYAECDYAFGIGTQKLRDGSQVYNTREGGKLVTYTHIDSTDAWFRSEATVTTVPQPTPVPDTDPQTTVTVDDTVADDETEPVDETLAEESTATPEPTPDTASDSKSNPKDKEPSAFVKQYSFLTMEKDTEVLNNLKVYVLTGALSGADWKDMLLSNANLQNLMSTLKHSAPVGVSLEGMDLSAMDFSDVSAAIKVYVDKKTATPVQVDLTVNGMDSLVWTMLSVLPKDVTAMLGESVSVGPMRVTLSNLNFDAVTVPSVPEDGRLQGAQADFNPNRGNGTYIIQESGDAVTFTAQEGWLQGDAGYCYVSFTTEDKKQSADFALYRNQTAEGFIRTVSDALVPAIEARGLEVTKAASAPIGNYETYTISAPGINVFLAYRNVGSAFLGIYVVDSHETDLTTTMTPILDTVKDYTLE